MFARNLHFFGQNIELNWQILQVIFKRPKYHFIYSPRTKFYRKIFPHLSIEKSGTLRLNGLNR
jgi:hypothetical protein